MNKGLANATGDYVLFLNAGADRNERRGCIRRRIISMVESEELPSIIRCSYRSHVCAATLSIVGAMVCSALYVTVIIENNGLGASGLFGCKSL